uniref:CARD- and ANK-containing Inflammasome Adaptor Protein n=1 Tax=Amphiprion ocellaris TaxID=80972 RepID=A0AAQ5XJ27_AMPOC
MPTLYQSFFFAYLHLIKFYILYSTIFVFYFYTSEYLSSALHLAVHGGSIPIVQTLLEQGTDPNIAGAKGQTPLHLAAQCNRTDLTGLLLEVGAQKTALHVAAVAGKVDAVTSLLSHKAKAGTRDMDGSTPLHYAAAGGHAGVVSALLHSLKSKGTEDRNAWRKTPLHAAAEKGHDHVVVLLLEAGAKINSTDQNKDTPLHCAARGGHQEVVKRLVNWGQAGQKGRRNQVNLQATNNVGRTALQMYSQFCTHIMTIFHSKKRDFGTIILSPVLSLSFGPLLLSRLKYLKYM